LGAEASLTARRVSSPAGTAALWVGVLAGPIAWGADLLAGYATVQWTCSHHNRLPLHLISLAALLIIALGAYWAWTSWREVQAPGEVRGASSIGSIGLGPALVLERARFMAALGLASSAFFTIVVIATELAQSVSDGCR